ncbi:MAG: RluA family pseudouridine synthase [Gammaproteobacteria bacterium]
MERIPPVSDSQSRRCPVRHVQVDAEQAGRRIDNYLTSELRDIPKTRIYQMLRRGEVRVNGKRVRQGYRLEAGEEVRIPPVTLNEAASEPAPREYLLDMIRGAIIYEDRDLIVINKPSGLVVHSGSGRTFGVIELLRFLYPEQADKLQLAHRLDRETSGVLLVTRSLPYLTSLQECFREGKISKHYQALLKGRLEQNPLVVTRPLERNIVRSGERLSSISEAGKSAHTEFRMSRVIKGACLVDIGIKTGRTHQIRVHAASIDHPVAGDDKYGDRTFNRKLKREGLKHLFLHAASVHIPAINGKKALRIKAPLPDDLVGFINKYQGSRNT